MLNLVDLLKELSIVKVHDENNINWKNLRCWDCCSVFWMDVGCMNELGLIGD